VDSVQAPAAYPMPNLLPVQAGAVELLQADHPVLAGSDLRHDLIGWGEFWGHPPRYVAPGCDLSGEASGLGRRIKL